MKKIERKKFVFNYDETLEELVIKTIELLEIKLIEYSKIFKLDNKEKIVVNYFDKKENFRNFIYSLRGEKESLPEYATGTFDNGMVNAFIDPSKQMKKLYTANHELFHILYREQLIKNKFDRVVWYDEGMAQFLSGEKII